MKNHFCENFEELLQHRCLKFTQEIQRLREAVYNLELQAEIREDEHQSETEQLSHTIAEQKHKISTLKMLNNQMMDTEEERVKNQSFLTQENNGLKAEITRLKSKISALTEDATISRNTQDSSAEKILNLEEENRKFMAQIVQNERMIGEMYELTESLRDSNRDLKVQLELKQEEQVLLQKCAKSIKDEFDAAGENITTNFGVQTQQRPKTFTKSTQTENLSNDYTQPKLFFQKSTQTEHSTSESKQHTKEISTQTKHSTSESKRHTKEISTQTEAVTYKPKQLQTSSKTLPETEILKRKCGQVKNSTTTQAKTFGTDTSMQSETSTADCKSWRSMCVEGILFAGDSGSSSAEPEDLE
ncbi:cytoskeletal protein Sojo-like [Poeciliopsis prolifica]|uniref:cytoskeletal protein Sojo-like n=1 Tax=Poeciliopsis prolifica TaxID=188132 RepID=UPI0024130C20|nr:cytoskeletal protein Sojo-like [Poeciliopsis prolifica]